jgi:hypothetical protein
MKRIFFLIVALILVGWIWWMRADRRAEPAESADALHGSTVERIATTRPIAERDGIEERARSPLAPGSIPDVANDSFGLKVMSSTGLPLAFVEIEVEPRTWERRDLVDEHCDLSRVHVPCGVRAPGHVAAIAPRAQGTVVLEPDALLELDGEHLRECVPSIAAYGQWARGLNEAADLAAKEVAEISTSGFLDDRHWLLAIDADRIGRWFPDSKNAEVDLEWRDHHGAILYLAAKHGLRARWDVPCENIPDTAPLDVMIVRPADPISGVVVAELNSRVEDPGEPKQLELPWGSVQIDPDLETGVNARVPPDGKRIHWENVALGRQYLLQARDLASGAFGCLTIDHDGSGRTLSLHSGIVITGRLSVPPGAVLPTHARCIWGEVGELAGRQHRWGNWSNTSITEDGRFELRGWANLPSRVEECSAIPTRIELTIEAVGCVQSVTAHDVDANARCECGEILLETRPPQFVLLPGHGVPEDPLQHASLRISTKPEWSFLDVWGRSFSDGTYALYLSAENPKRDPEAFLAWSIGSSEYRALHPRELASESIPALLLHRDNAEGIAFQAASDGRYERVPVRKYAIDVDCRALPHDAKRWTLGWSWSKMVQRVDALSADAVGERRRIEFTAPESGASLWWCASDRLPGGAGAAEDGSLELEGPATALELP